MGTATIQSDSASTALERECVACAGTGEVLGVRCEECGGDGHTLTDFGRKVLDLVWKHFDGLTWTRG
jgi:DnaJ-class molecular chaperone